jgi:hypothetical protein
MDGNMVMIYEKREVIIHGGGDMVMFVFVGCDVAMLVTGVVMVVFSFVVGDMVMLVTGVNDGAMVVFYLRGH